MFKIRILLYWLQYQWRGKFRHRDALVHYQQKKLGQFFEKVLPKAPFYKKILDKNTLLADFPVVNKEFFMEHFEEMNTKGISKALAMEVALNAESSRDFNPTVGNVTIGLSTGTSGKRGLFMVSVEERAQWAAMIMTRVVRPRFMKKQRVAFFLRANSNLYSSVQSALFEFRYFDIFRPVKELAEEADRFQPHILAAQPSVLCSLAELQQKGKIKLRPSKIISFAEVLYQEDRKFIETVFNIPLAEVYQCTEGFLGATCEYGTMHLNEDLVYIEKKYLSENRFHPVITDFTRTTQPMVRYELNDILVERTEPCPCGSCFTALSGIEGRADDILLFRTKAGEVLKIYPDLLVRTIAQITDEFRNYRIRQVAYDRLTVELDCAGEQFKPTVALFEKGIIEFLTEREIEKVELSFVNRLILEPGAKLRKTERLFHEKN